MYSSFISYHQYHQFMHHRNCITVNPLHPAKRHIKPSHDRARDNQTKNRSTWNFILTSNDPGAYTRY